MRIALNKPCDLSGKKSVEFHTAIQSWIKTWSTSITIQWKLVLQRTLWQYSSAANFAVKENILLICCMWND
jgi:hypothetical protein